MARRFYLDFEKPVVELEEKLDELKKLPASHKKDIEKEIGLLEREIEKFKNRVYKNLTPWQKVQLARHPERPTCSRYLYTVFQDFLELHGDRGFGDDPAMVGGFAGLGEFKVMVVGQEKGTSTRERLHRNFGMPHPEGYRKAKRLYELAGKFGLPLITFIDTQGAYPGVDAEERGQAQAIADCLRVLSDLPTVVIAVNIGEGGSGGALALGVADRMMMLENSYYSVISPEGCAAILWHDQSKAPEAAAALRLTAADLLELGIIDRMIDEPLGGAHREPAAAADKVGTVLLEELRSLTKVPLDELLRQRYSRLRAAGVFNEPAPVGGRRPSEKR